MLPNHHRRIKRRWSGTTSTSGKVSNSACVLTRSRQRPATTAGSLKGQSKLAAQ